MLTAKSEDELQTAAHHLNKIVKTYTKKISKTKTKATGIRGTNIQTIKTEPDGKIKE
jgi:hypothetical protein